MTHFDAALEISTSSICAYFFGKDASIFKNIQYNTDQIDIENKALNAVSNPALIPEIKSHGDSHHNNTNMQFTSKQDALPSQKTTVITTKIADTEVGRNDVEIEEGENFGLLIP